MKIRSGLISITLLILSVFVIFCIFGCGGGSGTGGDTTGSTGGTGTATLDDSEVKQISGECLKFLDTNPAQIYDPSSDTVNEALEQVVNRVNEMVKNDTCDTRETREINIVVENPDGGTLTATGTYTRDPDTGDWEAELDLVFENYYVEIPYYDPSEFVINGAMSASISFSFSTGQLNASLSYTGYTLESDEVTYTYTGSYTQQGTLTGEGLQSATTTADVTFTVENSQGTGSMAASTETTMTRTDTNTYEMEISGSMVYSSYNGLSGTVSITTDTAIVISRGDVTDGKITITAMDSSKIVIEVTDTNEITVTYDGEVVYEGPIYEFVS